MADIFSGYDFPRDGVIRQAGNPYLFSCVDDYKHMSVWAYVLIEEQDIPALREGPEKMIAHFKSTTKPITVAMSIRGQGIVLSSIFVPQEKHSFEISVWRSLRLHVESLLNQKAELHAV